MNRETEIKLPVVDLNNCRKKIEHLPAAVYQPRHFEDNLVFDTEELTLRSAGNLLRLRITRVEPEGVTNGRTSSEFASPSEQGMITFKGKQQLIEGLKDREEIECTVNKPQNFILILERLGYSIRFRYQKYRTIFQPAGQTLHICLDETPIGNYLELEGTSEQIHHFAERLGFSRDQYITQSYASLYLAWCHDNGIEPGHMVFV